MTKAIVHLDILICTFRRPDVVETLLSLDAQIAPKNMEIRIIVADNDDTPSAAAVVADVSANMSLPVTYRHAPARNISIARNACLDLATGDWIAFIDDDEIAPTDWIANLMSASDKVDGVFGPAIAQYPDGAPAWMIAGKVHCNIPERRDGVVETGHTCNALLRWQGAAWQSQRFELARGKTGGEDTEFFSRIRQLGARFEIAKDAIVTEDVAPQRLKLGWLLQRKYRMGQSYSVTAVGALNRAKLAGMAISKCAFCALTFLIFILSEQKRMFWLLRAALHLGVLSGCLSLRQAEIYGHG